MMTIELISAHSVHFSKHITNFPFGTLVGSSCHFTKPEDQSSTPSDMCSGEKCWLVGITPTDRIPIFQC